MIDIHPDPSDVIVHSGPAERADVTGMPNLFAQSPRYRWRFIACGVAVTYRTDAAGLQLSGRVVQRRTVASIITLVQLVNADGLVVASVRAAHTMALDRHGRMAMDDSWVLAPGSQVAQPEESYTRVDDLGRHIWRYDGKGCWCAPAGLGYHVNEDGSRC